MPVNSTYNPTDPSPYVPAQMPESAAIPPPQQPASQPPPQAPLGYGGGKAGALGAIASIGDNILRGYMKGHAQAQQIKALRMKKQADAAQFSYNNDAEKFLNLVKQYGLPEKLMQEKKQIESETQAGGAPTGQAGIVGAVPNQESGQKSSRLDEINKQLQELGQAKGAVDQSWKSYLDIYGNLIDPQSGKGKGKKGGKKDAQGNPIQQAFSKDPAEKIQGIYGTLQRMGPPVYIQAQEAASKRAQSDKQYGDQKSGNEARLETLKSQLADLQQQDTSKMSDSERSQHAQKIQQTKDGIAALGSTPTGTSSTKFGTFDIPGASLASGKGPDGQPIKDSLGNAIDPNGTYRQEIVNGEPQYIPSTAKPSNIKAGSVEAFATEAAKEAGINPKELSAESQLGLQRAWAQAKQAGKTVGQNYIYTDKDTGEIVVVPLTRTTQPGKVEVPHVSAGGQFSGGSPAQSSPYMIGNPQGLVSPGNLRLDTRPIIKNSDGTHSSEYSFSFGTDKGEVLIPTVVNGKFLTPDGKKPKGGSPEEKAMFEKAKQHYYQTGENLGVFDTPGHADAYANTVHNRQQSTSSSSHQDHKKVNDSV